MCFNAAGTVCGVASPGAGGAACAAAGPSFALRFTVAGVLELFPSVPWAFVSSTAGTFAADLITGLPSNTDITVESLRSTGTRATTVLRVEGTTVRVLSASVTP